MKQQWLKIIPVDIGNYLAGFTDGEGSFNLSMRKNNGGSGWYLDPSFNISQKDETILALFKRYLGCGTLRNRKDGVIYYEVRNKTSLYERVIPFFQRFRLLSVSKKKNYSIFKKIIECMYRNEHHSSSGLRKILGLRELLNEGKGRKRKYSINDLNNSEKILRDYTPNSDI